MAKVMSGHFVNDSTSIKSNNSNALKMKSTSIVFSVLLMGLTSCASWNSVNTAIRAYEDAAAQVSLGQSKEQVLAALQPTQSNLSTRQRKSPEKYTKDGKLTEIYFYRSHATSDGLLTDDEFTPYIFEDGSLVGIGWTLIGGPKTQAQTRDDEPRVRFHFGHTHFW